MRLLSCLLPALLRSNGVSTDLRPKSEVNRCNLDGGDLERIAAQPERAIYSVNCLRQPNSSQRCSALGNESHAKQDTVKLEATEQTNSPVFDIDSSSRHPICLEDFSKDSGDPFLSARRPF